MVKSPRSHTPVIVSTNPSDGSVLGQVPVSTKAEVNSAVSAARTAFPAWRDTGIAERAAHLQRLLAIFKDRRADIEIATTREMGQPIAQARSSNDWAFKHFQWYLDNAARVLQPTTTYQDEKQLHLQVREPFGVNAVISPWNFPSSNFVTGVVQSLLAGNTVVYKVSEEVVLFGALLDQLIADAQLPKGVFNQVYGAGDVGEELAKSEINLLFFTGSSRVGQALYRICAEFFIPCVLELGGSDVGIVCEDVQLELPIESIFWSKFINNGQICCGLKRLLVHRDVFDEVVERLRSFIETQPVGDPMDENTVLGPLAAERQRALLAEQVADAVSKGAKAIHCSQVASTLKGAYYPPTLLLGVTPIMRVWGEELFGPVLTVIPFANDEEALSIANATEYGLSGFVYTNSVDRFRWFANRIETGAISHNGCDYSEPFNAFGGYKKSGLGKTGGELGFHSVTRVKALSMWR